jgi:hypothetical protein
MTDSPTPETGPVQALDLIAGALASLQTDLPTVDRDKTGEIKGQTKDGTRYSYEYSYADLAAVTKLLYPRMGPLGLSFVAAPTVNDRGQFVLRYKLLHTSGQSIPGEYPLPTDVKSPQAMGSAITYARRYCLCAVTGVVTEDDDGSAAQHAARDQSMQPADPERSAAVSQVAAAWVAQYGARPDGSPDWDAIGREFTQWSNGKRSQDVPSAELRRFAGYLSALPTEGAGSEPASDAGPKQEAPKMSSGQRGLLFKLMGEIGLTDRGDQLRWINKQLSTEYQSRSLISAADAKVLIDGLQKGIDAPSEPAP